MTFSFLQIFLVISLPIVGMAYALIGGIKLPLVERLQIDEGRVGWLLGAFGTMFGPTILACGFLTDSVGRKGVWMVGSTFVAIAIFLFSRAKTFWAAIIAVFMLGAGWAAQINVANVLMRVSLPADRPREELIWATNFYDFVFGFGTLMTPMLLGPLLRKLGFERGLKVMSLVAMVPVVLGALVEMNPVAVAAAGAAAAAPAAVPAASSLLGSPIFWVVGLAFLFYVPLETAVAGWATTLVLRQTPADVPEEKSKKTAAMALSGFWLGFTGSRLIVSILGTFGILAVVLGSHNEQTLLMTMHRFAW